MITAYIDIKSLGSYLAIKPICDLAKKTGVAIEWRPFVAPARALPTLTDDETVTQAHHRVRAEAEHRTHLRYAKLLAIEYCPPLLGQDLETAMSLIAAADGNKTALVRALFKAYWMQAENLDDVSLLRTLCGEAGVTFVEPDVENSALLESQSEAERMGVFDAPTFIVKDQLFLGRAHLPWIEQLLTNGD